MFRGHLIGRLEEHFGLVSDEGLMGLTVISRELPLIDLDELVRLNIRVRLGLRGVVNRSITDQSRFATWMISFMTQPMDASGRTYQDFDSTLVCSSHMSYQRRIRQRTSEASTLAAPYTADQPDPLISLPYSFDFVLL
ncbi:hypothetical protein Tco_1001453 [Tanacetum coccineum]